MGTPMVLVDSVLSVAQYDVTLTPSQEVDGIGTGQAFRVADGRTVSKWTGSTTNVEYSLIWNHAIAAPFTVVALHRGYIAPRIILETDNAIGFPSATSIFDITLPTTLGSGTLDGASGVLTTNGHWLKRVASAGETFGRIRIPAMGAGLKPEIPVLSIGTAWAPGYRLWPLDDESDELIGPEVEISTGARGRGRQTVRRNGQLQVQFMSRFATYATALPHLTKIRAGRPFWLMEDDAAVDAVFAIRDKVRMGFPEAAETQDRAGVIPWVEII